MKIEFQSNKSANNKHASSLMNLKPSINDEYQKYQSDLIRTRLNKKITFDNQPMNIDFNSPDIESYIKNNLFFITGQFSGKNISDKLSFDTNSPTGEALASFYQHMSKEFINYAFQGNSKLLPFLQLNFDAENSRYSTTSYFPDVPHFHGLLLLHPKTIAAFENWLLENGTANIIKELPSTVVTARGFAPLDTITFSKFDPNRKSLDQLISYVSKYARNDRFSNPKADWKISQRHDDFSEMEMIFPRIPKRFYPFYKLVDVSTFTEAEFASFEKEN